MRAALREGSRIVAAFESDDPQRLGEDIGSEIHQLLVSGWAPDELTIEFDRAAELKEGER